jgi:hypothetical protein
VPLWIVEFFGDGLAFTPLIAPMAGVDYHVDFGAFHYNAVNPDAEDSPGEEP